jgi:hypothetical protein
LLSFFQFYHPWPIKEGLIDKTLFRNKANGIVIPQPDISINIDNKAFDQYIGYNFALLIFNDDDEILDDIKLIKNAKIYGGNIHQFKSDHPFNKDKSFLNWQKKHNIGAVIIRPDRHVYGCCEDNDMLDKITKLTNQLHKDLYLN